MERGSLKNIVLLALSREPYIYIVDDGSEREVDRIMGDLGLWGLVVKVKLRGNNGGLTAYVLDLSKIERLCAYEACSKLDNSVKRDSCISKCISAKAASILLERVGG